MIWRLQALIGDVLLLSLSAAYVSDLISPGNRATALSLNLAGLSVAYTVGPIISGSLWTIASIWISAGGTCLSILMMLLLVPESASEPAKLKVCPPHPCMSFLRWLPSMQPTFASALQSSLAIQSSSSHAYLHTACCSVLSHADRQHHNLCEDVRSCLNQ